MTPTSQLGDGLVQVQAPNPSERHFSALMHLLRYIQGSLTLGISYGGESPTEASTSHPAGQSLSSSPAIGPIPRSVLPPQRVVVFADVSFAPDKSFHSFAGWIAFFNGGPIAWGAGKLQSTATSTTEAELLAASRAVKNGLYLQQLLVEFGAIPDSSSIQLYADNQAANRVINGGNTSGRLRHVAINSQFMHEHVLNNRLQADYVHTSENIADSLTKSLNADTFTRLRAKMNMFAVTTIESEDQSLDTLTYEF